MKWINARRLASASQRNYCKKRLLPFHFRWPVRKQRARSLAPKRLADELPVATNQRINALCHKYHAGYPQHECKRNHHREAHGYESDGACASVYGSLGCDAMNGLIQRVSG